MRAGFLTLLLLSSCKLLGARASNQTFATVTTWKGSVPSSGAPTFVVLLRKGPNGWQRQSSRVFYSPGAFEFLARPGEGQVFAFIDINADQAWQDGEPSALGKARALRDGETDDVGALTPEANGPKPPVAIDLAAGKVTEELVKVHRGDECALTEERFSVEAGNHGFWEPVDFAQKYGVGVSMVEPYDGVKTPVLFVHGASGTPANFKTLIAALDRQHFTPWVYSYPSGIRLDLASTTLRRIIDDMQLRLQFKRLLVVAHSMGGLVARAFVAQVHGRPDHQYVKLLLTLSTPFDGHELAQTGVDHAPVIVPCWLDMATGSPFLVDLRKPLQVPHVVFFSYVGGANSDGPTDGTVSVRSMLTPAIQDAAVLVRGFPFTHDQILEEPVVFEAVNRALRDGPLP